MGQVDRAAILAFNLLIVAILFLIMDVNRPQRGTIVVGVETLERVRDSISAPQITELVDPGSPTCEGISSSFHLASLMDAENSKARIHKGGRLADNSCRGN